MEIKDLPIEERDKAIEFMKHHWCPDKPIFSYSKEVKLEDFALGLDNSSGIGTNYWLTCNKCGYQQDITDYGSW